MVGVGVITTGVVTELGVIVSSVIDGIAGDGFLSKQGNISSFFLGVD